MSRRVDRYTACLSCEASSSIQLVVKRAEAEHLRSSSDDAVKTEKSRTSRELFSCFISAEVTRLNRRDVSNGEAGQSPLCPAQTLSSSVAKRRTEEEGCWKNLTAAFTQTFNGRDAAQSHACTPT